MCSECSFVTQKRTYLKRHLKLSHGQDSDPSKIIICKNCDFEAKRVQHMKYHTNTVHLNQKRFKCSKCDFKCYHKSNIKSHMVANHANNEGEIERICCSQCRSSTEHNQCQKDEKTLRAPKQKRSSHKKTNTKRQEVFSVKRETMCSECSFVTQKSRYLKVIYRCLIAKIVTHQK